jgi:hypothetical protein
MYFEIRKSCIHLLSSYSVNKNIENHIVFHGLTHNLKLSAFVIKLRVNSWLYKLIIINKF